MALGSKKGVLLTLLMIILFILMLAEVITYIVINSNYDTLTSLGAQAATQSLTKTALSYGAQNFLHSSLYAALGALHSYDGAGSSRQPESLATSQAFLQSLIYNGTYLGVSFNSTMGTATLTNFVDTVVDQARSQGINLTVSNSTITVWQGAGLAVNASYTGLFTSSSSVGTFSYPVAVTTSVLLNGSYDPISTMLGSPNPIQGRPSYPTATVVGNVFASSGSTSPFMFFYGPVLVVTGSPTCGSSPIIDYPNSAGNMILAVYNGVSLTGSCNFGALVDAGELPSGAMTVPYLEYNSPSIFNSLDNGTSVLLSGPSLALLNISQIQLAMQNSYFYSSPYTPTYLDEAKGSYAMGTATAGVPRVPTGFFTLGNAAPEVAYFNGANSNVVLSNSISVSAPYSISFWFDSAIPYTSSFTGTLLSSATPSSFTFTMSLCGTGGCMGTSNGIQLQIGKGTAWVASPVNDLLEFEPNTWYNVVLTVGKNGADMYVNGGPPGVVTYGVNTPILASAGNSIVLGETTSRGSPFSGAISGFTIYNDTLTPQEVQDEYYRGVGGVPASFGDIVAFLPLAGNAQDATGNGNGGTATNIAYGQAKNYFGDPIYRSLITPYMSGSREVEGVLNCANINQCSNSAYPHLYFAGLPLSVSNGNTINESGAFGIGQATLPEVLGFQGNIGTGGQAQQNTSIAWLDSATQAFSVSLWIYPTTQSGVILDEQEGGSHSAWMDLVNQRVEVRLGGLGCATTSKLVPLNQWSDITMTYDGSNALNVYYNGTSIYSNPNYGTRTAPASAAFYDLGRADSTGCGAAGPFSGMMSDFQIYNSVLSAGQAASLYENDTVSGVPLYDWWKLRAGPYGGSMLNQSVEADGTDGLHFNMSGGNSCTVQQGADGACPVGYTLP